MIPGRSMPVREIFATHAETVRPAVQRGVLQRDLCAGTATDSCCGRILHGESYGGKACDSSTRLALVYAAARVATVF